MGYQNHQILTRRPFNAKGYTAKDLLELIYLDVCDPMSIQARGGYEYFITFTSDYSRFGKFKEFRAEVENQLDKHIKAIRSNRGDGYLLGDFKDYLTKNGTISQLTALGTQQQNGVAERRNMTLLDMGSSMLSYSTLPISF